MEITLKYYEDEKYDNCGNETMAVLHIGSIKIPLCEDCFNELKVEVDKIAQVKFCGHCKYIKWGKWGDRASCNLQGDISDECAGYDKDVFYYDNCPHCKGFGYEPKEK